MKIAMMRMVRMVRVKRTKIMRIINGIMDENHNQDFIVLQTVSQQPTQ